MVKFEWSDIVPSGKDLLMMATGLIVYAIGFSCFILPYEMTSGGVSGIGALIYYVTGFPPSYTYFIINVALLAFALKILGVKYTVKTLIATGMISLLIGVGQSIVTSETGELYKVVGEQKFLACVLGGLSEGIGLGLVFQAGGSTGGSDIIASIINKYKPISLGRAMLMIDIFIVSLNWFVLRDMETLVMSYCMMFIAINMIDYVINGARQSVQFIIISENYEQIATRINNELDRGCTILEGHGWYSKQKRPVLLVMAKKFERKDIFDLIHKEDPNAFVSMSNVEGVFGEGFDPIKK
ncbi:MAG: YitT family protein [Bacteroides sp.]|nr:YitT family protein [Bacteroides sp.]MCM1447976.1 YitT family protein [Bacteroides sp.]MCM1515444.1 YitT family protein [Paraprevotella sp.]